MKSVLFVIGSSQIGGAEKQFCLVANSLRTELELSLCILGNPGPFRKKYLELGLPTFQSSGSYSSDIRVLVRAISETRPKSIVTWLYRADVLGSIFGRILRVPKVITSARNTVWPSYSPFKRMILVVTNRLFTHSTIANSNKAAAFHQAMGYSKHKFSTIRNFVQSTHIDKWDESPDYLDKETTFGIASRPTYGKGHSLAISALNELVSSGYKVRLSIAAPKILAWPLIKEFQDHAKFPLILTDGSDGLDSWFSSIDIFLALSEMWDSDSNSLLEAIIREKPVISSLHQAIEDVVDFMICIPTHSDHDLVQAIQQIMSMTLSDLRNMSRALKQALILAREPKNLKQEWLRVIRG